MTENRDGVDERNRDRSTHHRRAGGQRARRAGPGDRPVFGRGYNIESLTVAEVEHDKAQSRITLVTSGTPMIIEQIKNQLGRLVPVRKVRDLTIEGPHVEQELALVKVDGTGEKQVESCVSPIFSALAWSIAPTILSFSRLSAKPASWTPFVELMRPLGLVDVSRTGVVAISPWSPRALTPNIQRS